jgi:hypothetical protein
MKSLALVCLLLGCIPPAPSSDQYVQWQAQMEANQARALAEANAWQLVRTRSPLDGGTNIHARKSAGAGPSSLVLRCEERRLRIGVATGTRLHRDFDSVGMTTPIHIRIGEMPPHAIDAEVGPDHETFYLPDADLVLARLQSARDLAVQYQPAGRERDTVTVAMGDARGVLDEVRAACSPAPHR